MFALRVIEEKREGLGFPWEQVSSNFELGPAYTLLQKGATKEFDEVLKKRYPEENEMDISAVVCGENGKEFFIFGDKENRTYSYFIMTEGGKTFERL